jgi:hypothetical protein
MANAFPGTGDDGDLIFKDLLFHSFFSSKSFLEFAPFIGNS